jgi:hypothetical protein
MQDQGAKVPNLKFKTQLYLGVMLVIAVVASFLFVKGLVPDRSPILDARFEEVPLLNIPGNGATCPVHHVMLQEDVVPIHYGLIRISEQEHNLRTKRFPYANSSHLGGCCVQDTRRARVMFCPECREAEKEWMPYR